MDGVIRRREMVGEGRNIAYQGYNLVFDGTNYINTGVALFSADNIGKDFRLTANLSCNRSLGSGNAEIRCIIGCMREVSPYPGFVVRRPSNTNVGSGVIGLRYDNTNYDLVIQRVNGVISVTGAWVNKVKTTITTKFDTPVTLGCEFDANNSPYRYMGGTINSIVIEWL